MHAETGVVADTECLQCSDSSCVENRECQTCGAGWQPPECRVGKLVAVPVDI